MRKFRQRIIQIKGAGKLEAAISQVMDETGLARSTVFAAYKLNDKEAVLESEKLLGYGNPKDSESGQK